MGKQEKHIILYATDKPEVYGNLHLFCKAKGIKHSTYVRKKMPFEFKGSLVSREFVPTGKFEDYLVYLIKKELSKHIEHGNFLYEFDLNESQSIQIRFCYNGKFEFVSADVFNIKTCTLNMKVSTSKVEEALNSNKK